MASLVQRQGIRHGGLPGITQGRCLDPPISEPDQAPEGGRPDAAARGREHPVDEAGGQPFLPAPAAAVPSLVAEEGAFGPHPDESFRVLGQAGDGSGGQALVRSEHRKGEAPAFRGQMARPQGHHQKHPPPRHVHSHRHPTERHLKP